MGVCLFVASGLNFDVDQYLRKSAFQPMTVFRKAEVPSKGNPKQMPQPDSGFAVKVSERSEALPETAQKALTFLVTNEQNILRLRECGVDNMLLDFGVEQKGIQVSQYLPPELIVALGRFGMGLVFSSIQVPTGGLSRQSDTRRR